MLPVAFTLQHDLPQSDGNEPNRSLPTDAQWQHWLNRWWDALMPDDLPYLAPLLAVHPKDTWAIALTLQLTTDNGIQILNRDYRNSDRPTDVLAFAALEGIPPAILMAQLQVDFQGDRPADCQGPQGNFPQENPPEPIEIGDVIISLDTAQAQAQTLGHSLALELAWLAAHGLLHLLGWDHPDSDHLQMMLRRQQSLLSAANLGTVNWGAIDTTDLGYR